VRRCPAMRWLYPTWISSVVKRAVRSILNFATHSCWGRQLTCKVEVCAKPDPNESSLGRNRYRWLGATIIRVNGTSLAFISQRGSHLIGLALCPSDGASRVNLCPRFEGLRTSSCSCFRFVDLGSIRVGTLDDMDLTNALTPRSVEQTLMSASGPWQLEKREADSTPPRENRPVTNRVIVTTCAALKATTLAGYCVPAALHAPTQSTPNECAYRPFRKFFLQQLTLGDIPVAVLPCTEYLHGSKEPVCIPA